ncbi:MAG TPA: LacI family DNA-binding transcriptional regulator [Albitalea sp.]|nr:LacI family DNA-binding transcriptional regulator [Albitalea sp.]
MWRRGRRLPQRAAADGEAGESLNAPCGSSTVRRCATRRPWHCAVSPSSTSVPTSKPKPSIAAPQKSRRRSDAPTLVDVARAAGVSEMAASSALNGGRRGSARVSVQTRERVLAAAQQLGYRPNAAARALASQRTNAIGFVADFLGDEPNLYFLEVFSGVIQSATAAGQTTSVFTLGDWDEAPARIPPWCDGRVDGLILLGPRLRDDGSSWIPPHTPMVSVQADRHLHGVVNIESDDEAGARKMVRHLLAMGHRRILHVGGPAALAGANRRVDGYLRAHAEAGVKPAAGHVVRAPLTVEGGRGAMQEWLQRHRGRLLPQAVFAGNDAMAFGCIEVLRERGLRVPEDISVVGYDHTLMARWAHLATVRQPLHEIGRQAADLLLQRIEALRRGEPYAGPSDIVVPTEIVSDATLAGPRTTRLTIG